MNLDQVKTFVAVLRSGSISAAARRLGLPRTTISARIVALENQLKTQLIRRSTRRIVPTETGKALYHQVQGAIDTLARVADSFDSPGVPLSGRVRCTVPEDFPQDVLEKTLISLQQIHPMIQVELLFSNTVSQLVNEDIDVALRVGRPTQQSSVIRRLGSIDFAVVAHEAYLERRGVPASVDDLGAHRLLTYTGGGEAGTDSPLKHWAQLAKKPVFSSTSLLFLKRMACKGFGVACLPSPLCEQDIAAGRLRTLEIPEWEACQEDSIYLIYPSHRDVTSRVRAFTDHLVMALNP